MCVKWPFILHSKTSGQKQAVICSIFVESRVICECFTARASVPLTPAWSKGKLYLR